ncbi:NUDIX domain-containing protein [Peterkaempfera sp. SMS 1(5)a]|uniref:NUDIX hydrolase n=1 Tax=Peterkaempfera podocarpi TaxID=3232308 RepID=UPI00366D0E37
MPWTTRSDLRGPVLAYLERHPAEHGELEDLLAALDTGTDPTCRATLPGHITCSAVVIDRDRRVLHIQHKAGGQAPAPGGHLEAGDQALLAAALRELSEAAGIAAGELCLTPQLLGMPIDIDVQRVGGSPAKGEPADQHYDVRFAFYLADGRPGTTPEAEEASGIEWRPFEQVGSPTLRAKLLDSALDGRPEPVNASVLIFDDQGRYLLHLRDNYPDICEPGAFALLGGGRETVDRSLEETLRRELGEEVPGLALRVLEPFAVERAISTEGLSVPVQVFAGRWNGDPAALRLCEGVLLHWCPPELLHRLRLSDSTRDLIHRHAKQQALAPRPRPLPPSSGGGTALTVIGAHLYLEDDQGRVLLGLRHPDSAYAGNTWHFLAGHCEQESAVSCLVREAFEEAGLVIHPADVEFAHAVHLVDRAGDRPRMQMVFRAHRWTGMPEVREPDKCLAWQWWDPDGLPAPVVPYARAAIDGIRAGRTYTELGW